MGFEDRIHAGLKELLAGCLTNDPAKRWTAKQAHKKLQDLCKAEKIANPDPSPEYSDADFEPFMKHVAAAKGKTVEDLFAKHKALLKMLGKIPIALKKKIDLKTLPIVNEIEFGPKKEKFFFQGNLDEKKQPKGLGCLWNERKFEFGVYGEAPFCVTRFKVNEGTVTIIPNYNKPMKTHVNLNGVSFKGYGHVFGHMSFPDGRYYQGGFNKARDFSGVGKYLCSNGDFIHGEWKDSKFDGIGKMFIKAQGKWVYGTFKNQSVGINPKDLKDLDPDNPIKIDKEQKYDDWTKGIAAKNLQVYFF